jgi:transcriptional regulator with XRE-family HTH domain
MSYNDLAMLSTPGPLLRQARLAAGLTQAQLAERLGTEQPVIARLESPRSNPRAATLRRAIRATGHDLQVTLRASPAEVDETMLAENLRLAPAERLRRFRDAYASVASLASRARRAGGP